MLPESAPRIGTFSLSSPLLPNFQIKQIIKRLRGLFPVEHFAHCFLKCAKKAVLAPFAPFYSTYPFCWAVFHKCSTEPHFMFHDDYQSINKNRLRNEIPWNTMFHAPFPNVPRNVPRHPFIRLRSEELGMRSYIKLGVRSYIYNICTCVRAQEGGLYIIILQRWSLLMTKA